MKLSQAPQPSEIFMYIPICVSCVVSLPGLAFFAFTQNSRAGIRTGSFVKCAVDTDQCMFTCAAGRKMKMATFSFQTGCYLCQHNGPDSSQRVCGEQESTTVCRACNSFASNAYQPRRFSHFPCENILTCQMIIWR